MANDIFLDTGHDRVTEVLELQKKQQKKKAEKIDGNFESISKS